MATQDALLDVVATIYAAPGGVAGWNRMMEAINGLTGSKATVYLLVNKEDLANEVTAFHGFSESDRSVYEGPHGAAKDVRFRYLHNLLPGKVFREFEYVLDRAAWDASEWIQYQREALGCYWCMSARVSTHGLWDDFLSVNRLETLGQHTDQEKANLQALLPHIARAAELHRTLTGLERHYGAVLAVLDQLLIGLIIVDRFGRVAVANITAREVCESSGLMSITRAGRVEAKSSHEDAKLQSLIAEAISTATAKGTGSGGPLALGQGDKPVLAEVLPLRDDSLPDGEGIHGAAIFLIDPAVSRVVSTAGIARIFGLTPSEQSVAEALANGQGMRQIAESRGTSVETVRKQLKSVFSKTGSTSQLELLQLAVKADPPVRRG